MRGNHSALSEDPWPHGCQQIVCLVRGAQCGQPMVPARLCVFPLARCQGRGVRRDGVTIASKSFSRSLGGHLGDVNSCLWLVKVTHAHPMRWSNSTRTALVEVTNWTRNLISSSGGTISMFIPCFFWFRCRVGDDFLFSWSVVAGHRAVVAVSRVFGPRMRRMSSAYLRWEKFAWQSSSTSLAP